MNPIHSAMHVSVTLETEDKDRALGIPELENAARVAIPKMSDGRLNIDLSSAGPTQVATSLERHGIRVNRYWMSTRYRSDPDSASGEFTIRPEPLFWDSAPDD